MGRRCLQVANHDDRSELDGDLHQVECVYYPPIVLCPNQWMFQTKPAVNFAYGQALIISSTITANNIFMTLWRRCT